MARCPGRSFAYREWDAVRMPRRLPERRMKDRPSGWRCVVGVMTVGGLLEGSANAGRDDVVFGLHTSTAEGKPWRLG